MIHSTGEAFSNAVYPEANGRPCDNLTEDSQGDLFGSGGSYSPFRCLVVQPLGTKMHPSGTTMYQLNEYDNAVSVQYCKTELFEVRLTPTA